MPRNVIYQTLGISNIQNFEQKPIIKQKNKLIIPIKMKRTAIRCPQCQQKEINVKGWTERKLATPPIGSKPVVLKVEVPRVECKQCPGIKHAHLPFAEPRKQHTRHFARYVVDLRKCMTILDLARHLGVSEWMIRRVPLVKCDIFGVPLAVPVIARWRTNSTFEKQFLSSTFHSRSKVF